MEIPEGLTSQWRINDYDILKKRLEELYSAFDVIRIIDPKTRLVVGFDDKGKLIPGESMCTAPWNRLGECQQCITKKAFEEKGKASKLEFLKKDIYFIIAQYMEYRERPLVVEMVCAMEKSLLIGTPGKTGFVEKIAQFNAELYRDSLTKAWNRKYYDEKRKRATHQALAMIDVDRFKEINDTYGHAIGDKALQIAVKEIYSCVRRSDILVRYGGDEFLLCFPQITEKAFRKKISKICRRVEQAVIPECPEAQITLSIGGYFKRTTVQSLMLLADRMLYEAKENRNTVKIGRMVEEELQRKDS